MEKETQKITHRYGEIGCHIRDCLSLCPSLSCLGAICTTKHALGGHDGLAWATLHVKKDKNMKYTKRDQKNVSDMADGEYHTFNRHTMPWIVTLCDALCTRKFALGSVAWVHFLQEGLHGFKLHRHQQKDQPKNKKPAF